jgi:hypothetical protein
MHNTYPWLSEGTLGERTTEDVMRELFRLARSEHPHDTEDLLEIAATKGLRFPRIAMDAAMKGRDIARQKLEEDRDVARESQEAKRLAEVRRLERFLAVIALLTCVAAILQAVAAAASLS